ncbi:stellacyanin-like [Cynara cardunculus var. scolymus]|uniref:stellacyanin-like n=1 Tax=Cynara cardunculus var. scolymus TaxID=59895 RepID=UPI000D624CCD|nr:stellacyanin-like [Cynara cardunculus var. scolymus]
MASLSTSNSSLCFFFIFAVAITTAKEFQVGGDVGWRIPATNETQLYNVWASRRRFHVGDLLRFRYKNDSVATVEKWGFYHCNSSTPITIHHDGDTVIHLYTMGTVYFISGDRDRCKKGQNMKVEVMGPELVSPFPPTIGTSPENPYSSAMAPCGSPESVTIFLLYVSVVGVMVGVGLFSWKP